MTSASGGAMKGSAPDANGTAAIDCSMAHEVKYTAAPISAGTATKPSEYTRPRRANERAVRFKVAWRDGHIVNAVPEFEDCARLASANSLSVKEVQALAVQAYGTGRQEASLRRAVERP